MIISLSKPLSVRGDTLSELDLDLDNLTGKDLIDIENSLRMKGRNTGAWDMSRSFMIRVAAQALKLPPETLEALPIRDFTKIIDQVLLFFAGQDSADSIPENSETSSSPSPSEIHTLD